ncbi:MAG TPA: Cu(I)-responsive transcriptional regulator [Burkholderiales bacterium]|nr:Cu(I)-responsive transcriptional regulator [Burkholderiales bacterium]
MPSTSALPPQRLKIGQAAAAAGLSAKMVRHYEAIGLLPRATRTTYSNYRLYGPNDVHTMRFVRRARSLGFSMAEIKELLGLWRNRARSSAAVKRIAGKHAEDLRQRIAELEGMVETLEHLMRHCHGDHRPECPILDELGRA